MARITVEDCLAQEPNRFKLVLMATQRARQLALGADSMLERGKDKSTVLALREIAEGHINQEVLDAAPATDEAQLLQEAAEALAAVSTPEAGPERPQE